jgi:hypothetical protein
LFQPSNLQLFHNTSTAKSSSQKGLDDFESLITACLKYFLGEMRTPGPSQDFACFIFVCPISKECQICR